MQTQTPEQQSAMVVSYHMSVSSDNDDLDRPRYATFRGDIWELRREVERLRRACAENGLYAVSILYPSLAVEWHDPRSEFRIESDRLVVNRMGMCGGKAGRASQATEWRPNTPPSRH